MKIKVSFTMLRMVPLELCSAQRAQQFSRTLPRNSERHSSQLGTYWRKFQNCKFLPVRTGQVNYENIVKSLKIV